MMRLLAVLTLAAVVFGQTVKARTWLIHNWESVR